jgi:hypothetical protein
MRYTSAYVISRENIEQFLHILARQFQQPSNLYLTGNAVLVHMGLRTSTTNILQLVVETADESGMVAQIQRSAEALHLTVEFTSPEDFVPIPWNWQDQARYVGPYGYIDVFYFDFVSLALGRIAQGSDLDLHDVWLLLQHKLLTLHDLDNAYLEVQPRMGRKPYDHIQPQQFAGRYAQIRKWLVKKLELASQQ